MRIEGWEHRLTDLIAAAQEREFQYGRWDCALLACASIQALTGVEADIAFRGRYHDEAGCAQVLAASGGLAVIASGVADSLLFGRIPPLTAWRGDVVLATIDGRPTLGVCVGRDVAFAVSPRGLKRVPITDPCLTLAWRIA